MVLFTSFIHEGESMRSIALCLSLLSIPALACPELEGTYAVCRSQTGNSSGSANLIVKRSIQNGVTVYTAVSTDNESQETTESVYIADGKTRKTVEADPQTGMEIETTTKVKCAGKVMKVDVVMKLEDFPMITMSSSIHKEDSRLIFVS